MSKVLKLGAVAGGACDRLLLEDEAIEILGLAGRPNPRGALRWLMRTRKIAYIRLARGMYGFRRGDLVAFIQASRVPAAKETRNSREQDSTHASYPPWPAGPVEGADVQ